MNIFNKYEAIGIFVSIAVMAVSLSYVRFKTDVFTSNTPLEKSSIGAVVVASKPDSKKGDTELETALINASTNDGKLVDLVVDDVRKGKGNEVKKGDTVVVNYIGTTRDGVKFDSSYDRGETFSFTVGDGKVIQGWEKGLIGMQIGGQRILVIPADMAYGNRQVGPIPPNTPLVFAVELVDIKK